jgi:antitoxin component of MazEF toxin-antitoxin module
MKIGKRGNGLWVRIPAKIVRELNLQSGDEAELVAVREHSFEIRRVPNRQEPAEKIVE